MYDVTAIKIIKSIQLIYPQLRVGQLILNVIPEEELYYIDNKKLAEKLASFYLRKDDDDRL